MNHLLSEAETPIREALERLVAKDEKNRPFVVIDKVGCPDVFVQFATKHGVLYFDVPMILISLQPTEPEAGAILATAALSVALGVGQDERVLIHEEEDKGRGKGLMFWKRLFA